MRPFNLAHYLQLFRPKLLTVLHEGYNFPRFIKDILAGLTVAVVALPLAMGIAIASGAAPERGLFTAIIAGFIISALGGSRYQIGGPTAAFIVVVYLRLLLKNRPNSPSFWLMAAQTRST